MLFDFADESDVFSIFLEKQFEFALFLYLMSVQLHFFLEPFLFRVNFSLRPTRVHLIV